MKSQGRMHFITKRVVKNHFEVKFTKKLPWKFTVSYRSKLTEEALKLQVILEKHGLELCGSSYTWIFFFSSKYFGSVQSLVGWNHRVGKNRCGGDVYIEEPHIQMKSEGVSCSVVPDSLQPHVP